MNDYLPAFKITSTHGVRGEMKAFPLCDGAAFLAKIKTLYTNAAGSGATVLQSVRAQGNMLLVTLDGVTDMDSARAQMGKTYYFAKADAKLPKGSFFIDDLLGCEVRDADTDAVYGKVTAVEHPAAQDIYTITDANGNEHMMPAVPEFVVKTDIDSRLVLVRPIEGMFGEAINGDKE